MSHALIVDADASTREALGKLAAAEGFTTSACDSLREARIQIGRLRPDVALVDLKLPDGDGMSLFDEREPGSVSIVIMSGAASVEDAVEAMRRGAADYLVKPVDLARLKAVLARIPRSGERTEPGSSLRQRGGNALVLANHFLDELNVAHGTRKALSPGAIERLHAFGWPATVRELKTCIERAYILADRVLDVTLPPAAPQPAPAASAPAAANMVAVPLGTSLDDADRELILATLEYCGGVRKRAADLLGISLKTLYNRLVAYRAQGLGGPVGNGLRRAPLGRARHPHAGPESRLR